MMLSDMDINAIAGTLKLYFRELPEPLLTDRLYPAFMEGIGATSHPINTKLTQEVWDILHFSVGQLKEIKPKSSKAVREYLNLTSVSSLVQPSRTQQPRRTA